MGSGAAWELPAAPTSVTQLRRRAVEFARQAGASDEILQAVALAVSETVANAVMHAYAGREPGNVTVRCRAEGPRLVVEVLDEGAGVTARDDSPGLGHGFATIGAMAQSLDVAARLDGPGTVVTMSFGVEAAPREVAGLEPLCALALDTIADVSCLDVVSGGVLRRATAEVAADEDLTRWLRQAVPPAKPGTATWAALREGGAHLVVHDPTVPRSPGGTGERLDLTWWISVPLDGDDGEPAALWGIGGRAGGRPVPAAQVLRVLGDAAQAGLGDERRRDALRERLKQHREAPSA